MAKEAVKRRTRPAKPPEECLQRVLRVLLTPENEAKVRTAAKLERDTVSHWLREMAIRGAEQVIRAHAEQAELLGARKNGTAAGDHGTHQG